MAGTEYTLTGFDDFLERRRVLFVEPLSCTRVCGICGVVPSRSLLLPCGHVLCQLCKDQISRDGGKCPLDKMDFDEGGVVELSFKQSDLEQHQVFCIAGGRKCSFAGKLSELKDHLIRCGNDKVKCGKCEQSVLRVEAVEHCRQCSAETLSRQFSSAIAAVEMLSSVRKDLESIREQASAENVDKNAVLNGANSLVERMANLQQQLTEVQQEVNGDEKGSLLSALKKTAFTPGPYRPASKHGNFIATCKFSDVYRGNKGFGTCNYCRTLSSDICTLAGYTFKLQCLIVGANFKLTAQFTLSLCEGAWDVCAEWPFSKKVMLIVTHTSCMGKDIRLPARMTSPQMREKPLPSNPDSFASTEKINLNDVSLQSFVVNNVLYVNVEFE